jgi:hypothetical protein
LSLPLNQGQHATDATTGGGVSCTPSPVSTAESGIGFDLSLSDVEDTVEFDDIKTGLQSVHWRMQLRKTQSAWEKA